MRILGILVVVLACLFLAARFTIAYLIQPRD